MSEQVLVLDGSISGGLDLATARACLLAALEARGAQVRTVALQEEALTPCKGCFGCWLVTPGLCRSKDRSGPLLEAMLGCGAVVLLTQVTAGGYGSALKLFVDHWIQTTLPFFLPRAGETHHPQRYPAFPRVVAIGVSATPDPEEERLFQAVVARNAVNFEAPSHSAGIVPQADPAAGVARILDTVLPQGLVQVPWPDPAPGPWRAPGPGHALLLVGSPKAGSKVGSGSTSGVLGGELLEGLRRRGWSTDALNLAGDLRAQAGREQLGIKAEAADLVVLAFPLYIDALPFLCTLALEALTERNLRGKALAVLVNNGFPEASQNNLALSICARFAQTRGMVWTGGLALGGGEAISGGVPLAGKARRGRPPAGHVVKALDAAAAALASGQPIPPGTQHLLSKSPIPGVPFGLWRWVFRLIGEQQWRQAAKRNGADLRARPLAG